MDLKHLQKRIEEQNKKLQREFHQQEEDAEQKSRDEFKQRVEERTEELSKLNFKLRNLIEERERVTEDLREAEYRYRTVADFTYAWEYWANLDGTLRYVSPSSERISGYEAEQFIKKPSLFRDIILPEDRDIWDKHYHDSRRDPKLRELQFRIITRNNKIRWIEHACQPVIDDQGHLHGFRASNQDITERKDMEEALLERERALKKSRDEYRFLADKLLTVQESERRRLAREMHDDLTQRLAVLAMDVGNLRQQCNDSPELVSEKLKEIQERLVKLSTDIHAISRQLHPSILDDLGLVDAIESECRNFTQREGIKVNYVPKAIPPKLSKEIGLTIYRIVQEGLRNIAKHAEAEEAQVSLIGHNNSISLIIQDAGKGFNPDDPKTKQGLGLISMEERTRLLNGELSIHSSIDQGTVIEARVPVEDK